MTSNLGLDGCIHEGVVGWRQREAELVEQVGQDQPHFLSRAARCEFTLEKTSDKSHVRN